VVKIDDPEAGAETLVEIVTRRIPRRFGLDPVKDVHHPEIAVEDLAVVVVLAHHHPVAGGEDPAEALDVEIVTRRIPRRFGLDPVKDVQVLCPMTRGALGRPAAPPRDRR
jgi:hypothetical protein